MKVFFLSWFVVASASKLSPVTRVVELLNGLSQKIEVEGKREEDLYESYVCWGKSVIEQKTASNAAAASRIDTLETYISDLESGRITLTSEQADLEKDIAELMSDLEQAKALREKEEDDFDDAKSEMTDAITALKSAMDVLEKATQDHKEGVFLAIRARLSNGMAATEEQRLNLKRAAMLGEKFLDKADATFLRRLLTGDVPKRADWKKLNRKATFKMKYKARSFKIQDVLKKMHETFTANLQEASQKEADAKASYESLAKSKGEQLSAAQDALSKSAVEGGARGESKEETQEEVDALKKQVADDERFIQETTASLEKKKAEWKVRSELRSQELAAISKAVEILHNDDSRDLFKKSLASQEGFFLQEGQHSTSAANVIRRAAQRSGDRRLLALASLLADPSAKDKFKPIIASIDKMISVLQSEEASDLKIKEECEDGRMADTRASAEASRDIDDMTDAMTKLEEEVQQIAKEVAAMTAEKEQTQKELTEAADLRKKEHAEWLVSNKEDEEAAETVTSARDVLANFYKEKGLAFVQQGSDADAPEVEAGEAPPPPPATWEGDYGGQTQVSQGIVAVLEMIAKDILNDQAKAKAEEDEAEKSFIKFKTESEKEIEALGTEIGKQKGIKGKKETEHGKTEDERRTKKGELDAVLNKMEDINPNCEYFTVNYKIRAENRQVELDGLVKAKAILQGGKFSKGPDPNREIKPGDAFLQRRA